MDIASLFRFFLLAAICGGSFLFLRIGAPVLVPAALSAALWLRTPTTRMLAPELS